MTNGIDREPAETDPKLPKPVRRLSWGGLGLPQTLDEYRFRDIAVALVVGLTIWAYVDVGPHARILAGHLEQHKTDFTVYTEAASAFFDGRDPYRVMNPRGWYYLYPPLFAIAIAPLTVFDSEAQALAWFALSVVLGFGCYFEGRRLWGLLRSEEPREAPRPPSRWVGFAVIFALILPSLDCLQRGQIGIMLLYLLMLGFRIVVASKSWRGWLLGGVVLALPAAIKLVPSLPVGFLVAQLWVSAISPRRGGAARGRALAVTAGVLVGAFLFLFAIPSGFLGWNKNLGYLRTWTTQIAANENVGRRSNFDIHSPRNQSLSNAVYLTTASRSLPPEIRSWGNDTVRSLRIGVLVFLAGLGLANAWGRRDRSLDLALGFSLASAATLLISPIAWGHYYMIELPALIVLPIWLNRQGRGKSAGLVLAFPLVLCWAHYLFLKHVAFFGVLGFGTTVWFLAVCVLIARSWKGDHSEAMPSPTTRKSHLRGVKGKREAGSVFY